MYAMWAYSDLLLDPRCTSKSGGARWLSFRDGGTEDERSRPEFLLRPSVVPVVRFCCDFDLCTWRLG